MISDILFNIMMIAGIILLVSCSIFIITFIIKCPSCENEEE